MVKHIHIPVENEYGERVVELKDGLGLTWEGYLHEATEALAEQSEFDTK